VKLKKKEEGTYRENAQACKTKYRPLYNKCLEYISKDYSGEHNKKIEIYMESLRNHEPDDKPEYIRKRLIEFFPEMKEILKNIGV